MRRRTSGSPRSLAKAGAADLERLGLGSDQVRRKALVERWFFANVPCRYSFRHDRGSGGVITTLGVISLAAVSGVLHPRECQYLIIDAIACLLNPTSERQPRFPSSRIGGTSDLDPIDSAEKGVDEGALASLEWTTNGQSKLAANQTVAERLQPSDRQGAAIEALAKPHRLPDELGDEVPGAPWLSRLCSLCS
jgi:hypothetical protein